MLFILMFFLAFGAGFATRRASLCLVRATMEIIDNKPAKTMFFVTQAMVIALSITIPAMLFFPNYISLAPSYSISIYLILGAFIYGVGAFLNGACALGTLNNLMNGKIDYIASIMGIAIGFFGFLFIKDFVVLEKTDHLMTANYRFLFLLPLMLVVWGVTIFQTLKFLKENEDTKLQRIKKYVTSSVARNYIGVTIFGLCSGILYLLLGRSWDYTSFIKAIETIMFGKEVVVLSIVPLLITTCGLIIGMGGASLLSKDFNLIKINLKEFAIKISAGSLMGFGAGLIPGGNDTLIFHGIPGLGVHAPIALVTIMMSIGVVIYTKFITKKIILKFRN